MSDNIHELPPPFRNMSREVVMEPGEDWIVGPFPASFQVVLDGKMVPNVTIYVYSDGVFDVSLDHRLGYQFTNRDDAYTAVRAIADAMAMGAGFPSFAAADRWPYGVQMTKLDQVPR